MKVVWAIMITIVVLCIIVFGAEYLKYKAHQTARDKLIIDIKGFCSSAQAWYRETVMPSGESEPLSVESTPRQVTSEDIAMIIGRIDPSAEAHIVVNNNGMFEFYAEVNKLIIIGTAQIDNRIKSKGEIVLGQDGVTIVEVFQN